MSKVFQKWAAKKPADAANSVKESPEKCGAGKISMIAGVVVCGDSLPSLKRVRHFPKGPYFDKAASGIISYINDAHPKEALDLAALIGDTKLREEAISNTKIKQQPAEKNSEIGGAGR